MSTREELPPMPPGSETTTGAEESLEQVRDILVGSHLRIHERKLARLEERLTREILALRADSKARFDALREELSRELSSLSRTLAEEQVERGRGHETLAQRIDGIEGVVVARLDELRAEAEHVHDDMRRVAEREVLLLREEQRLELERDRRALSGLFGEFGARLAKNGG